MLRASIEILIILTLIAVLIVIAVMAPLAWFAIDKASSAELIAQSPDTHWPEQAVDVRIDRIGDVMLATVSF